MHTFYSVGVWTCAVQCTAVLDVLISLAQFSRCGEDEMTRPVFKLPSDETTVSCLCQFNKCNLQKQRRNIPLLPISILDFCNQKFLAPPFINQ